MKSILLGIRGLDFSTEDGKVKGTQLFLAFPSDGVIGQETGKAFVRPELCPEGLADCIGSEIDVAYNNKGKVIGVEV